MIADLKPYEEYRESGLPWVGPVPAHWQVRQLRHACDVRVSNVDKKTKSTETPVRLCNYVEVYKNSHIRGSTPFMKATATEDECDRFRLRIDDVIITKDSEQWNDIGVPALVAYEAPDLVCGYHLAILRARPGLCGTFLYYALECHLSAAQFYVQASGVTRYGLSHGAIKGVRVLVPPPAEQAAIVRYLDWGIGRLDRAIRAKRKVLALLNEQKHVIIHRAVTRGLDPSVPLKPSGIPWLGEIPEHWEVAALRRYWTVTDCKHLTVPFVDDGIPLASVVEVQKFSLDLSRCKRTTREWYRLLIEGGREPALGDLIYCRNASVGACAIVDTELDFAMGQDVCLIRSQAQSQRFLNYVLHSPFMKHQLGLLLVGSTFKRINISQIKALTVIVPPRHEQDAVCEWLDARSAEFQVATRRLEREIELLREYRTRLIADVVTGKLDVREAAARLPDETSQETGDDEPGLADEDELAEAEAVA